MSEAVTQRNLPKLRFPGFSGAWEEMRLGDIVSLQSGFAFSSDHFGDAGRKLMTPKNFTAFGTPLFTDENTKRTVEEAASRFLCGEGSLLMLLTDLTPSCELLGKTVLLTSKDEEVWLNQRIVKIQNDPQKLDRQFTHGFFQTSAFHKRIVETASGSTVRHSSNRIIADTSLMIPTLPEQQKIADFLGAVDARVGLLRRRRDALKAYKKAMMQRLFARALRFTKPDGSPFPDWQEKRLGEIATFSKGRGVSKADIAENGGTPCIRYAELYTIYDEIIHSVAHATNEPEGSLLLSKKGDVIIPASGEAALEIAAAACVALDGIALGGDLNVIRSALNGAFLARYLRHFKRLDIAKVAQGNSVVHLYAAQLKVLKIEIPHPEEQQKIADFLTALDTKIDAVAAQIAAMQRFKQGLLQQMFV